MSKTNLTNGEDFSPIDFGALESRSVALQAEFEHAMPWPHIVIDDFLEAGAAARISAGFPSMGNVKTSLARLLEARSYDNNVDIGGSAVGEVFQALHSRRFAAFLEQVTCIGNLVADSDLVGAGLHQGARGSYLRVHADHNTHPADATRYRRINVMIYLNELWEPEWNGDLELWDRSANSSQKRIEPKFNRCVILNVDDTAFHGYGPLRVPPGRTRRALAAYYYTSAAALGQATTAHPTTMPILHTEHALSRLVHRVRRAVLFRIEKFL